MMFYLGLSRINKHNTVKILTFCLYYIHFGSTKVSCVNFTELRQIVYKLFKLSMNFLTVPRRPQFFKTVNFSRHPTPLGENTDRCISDTVKKTFFRIIHASMESLEESERTDFFFKAFQWELNKICADNDNIALIMYMYHHLLVSC